LPPTARSISLFSVSSPNSRHQATSAGSVEKPSLPALSYAAADFVSGS
jgi:hypothetical protein